ncbi:MAG: S1C family serine protease [Nitrososphaerales archaeon]
MSSLQTQVLQSFSDALVALVSRASPSVVQVSSGRGFGTGIVWDKEGHILTNSHVIGRSSKIEVSFPGGDILGATLVGQDRFSDIAVLKVVEAADRATFQPLERGTSDGLATGQFVLALANAFGEKVSACSGIITNPKGRLGGPWTDDLIITDVRLNRGYSGGPLIDATGKMIGMNTAVYANRGIAIPSSVLTTVVKELTSNGSVKRAYLGIVSNPISLPDELVQELGQSGGLLVLSVEPGTPAKKAGVAIGDIIVRVDSKKVEGYYDLHKILKGGIIGRETGLSVLRGEKLTELVITPTEA